MRMIFLGTSSSAPTGKRGLSGIALNLNGFRALFDCGEGTQQRLMQSGFRLMQIDAIFISHFHSDHFMGLPGLLATMNLYERETPLKILGPRGVRQKVNSAMEMAMAKTDFPIETIELKGGIVLSEKGFTVRAFELKHSTKSFGFCIEENDKLGTFKRQKAEKLGIPVGPLYSELQKGKSVKLGGKTFKPEQVMDYSKGRRGRKVCIILDTKRDEKYLNHLKNADVLVHESTFLEEERKRALETMHSTALDAAKVAKKAKAKKLYLTHFSPRYTNVNDFLREAKKHFPKTFIAKDLLEVNVAKNSEGKVK